MPFPQIPQAPKPGGGNIKPTPWWQANQPNYAALQQQGPPNLQQYPWMAPGTPGLGGVGRSGAPMAAQAAQMPQASPGIAQAAAAMPQGDQPPPPPPVQQEPAPPFYPPGMEPNIQPPTMLPPGGVPGGVGGVAGGAPPPPGGGFQNPDVAYTQGGHMPWTLPDLTSIPGWGEMNSAQQGQVQNNMNELAQAWALGNMSKVESLFDKLSTKFNVPPHILDEFLGGLGGAPGTTPQAGGPGNPMNWKQMPGFYSQADEGYKGALATLIKDMYRKEMDQRGFAREGQAELGSLLEQMQGDPLAAQIAQSLQQQMTSGTQQADAERATQLAGLESQESNLLKKLDEMSASRGITKSGDMGGQRQQVMTDIQQQRLIGELQREQAQEAAKERARAAAANWYASNYGLQGQLTQNIAGLPMGYQPQPLAGYMPNLPTNNFVQQNQNQWLRDAQNASTMNAAISGVGQLGGSILGASVPGGGSLITQLLGMGG